MSNLKPGWVWYEKKGGFRPFTEFRQIQKGKNKGKVEVTLPATPARRVLVDPSSIRSYPVMINPKGEEIPEYQGDADFPEIGECK